MSLSAIERKIAGLNEKMQAAIVAERYEEAAQLRDEIASLRATGVRQPPPGQMGLGTNIPVAEPKPGWTPPKKPDPMTRNVKTRKR